MRFRNVQSIALTVAVAAVPTLSSSAEAQGRLRGVMRFGLEHGGERVVQFMYADGSTPEVTAGGGLLLTVGGAAQAFRSGAHEVDAQLNLGLKYRTIPPATNQEANWLRFPVEGLLFYRTPMGVRLGGGAAVHLRNVLEASGATLNSRTEFQNTPGLLLQAEYVRGNMAFDLRYTALEYKVESGGSGTVGASSIGAGLSFFFSPSTRTATASNVSMR